MQLRQLFKSKKVPQKKLYHLENGSSRLTNTDRISIKVGKVEEGSDDDNIYEIEVTGNNPTALNTFSSYHVEFFCGHAPSYLTLPKFSNPNLFTLQGYYEDVENFMDYLVENHLLTQATKDNLLQALGTQNTTNNNSL